MICDLSTVYYFSLRHTERPGEVGGGGGLHAGSQESHPSMQSREEHAFMQPPTQDAGGRMGDGKAKERSGGTH
jgi:hypothetical protein